MLNNNKKILFIAGLHRSGTTPFSDILREHKDISGFKDTGYPKDEGQFLQSIYPIAKVYGGPGLFAFRKEMHLTEKSKLVTIDNKNKILNDWSKHWNNSKEFLMEKSPPNILKLRFLQALFPKAYFIVIIRNPVAVSYATQKWSKTPVLQLLNHWIKTHKIYRNDKVHIKNMLEIRYEDLVNDTEIVLKKVGVFLGLDMKEIIDLSLDDHNKKYIKLWNEYQTTLKNKKNIIRKTKLWLINIEIKSFGYDIINPSYFNSITNNQ